MITTIYHKANGFTVQLYACKYCLFSHDVTKNSNNKTIDPTEILLSQCIRAAEN